MTLPAAPQGQQPDASNTPEASDTGGVPPLHPSWLLMGTVAAGVAVWTAYDPKVGGIALTFLADLGGLYVLMKTQQ